ncbi:hypothetical protein [Massilia scottii]|uniref:hypothetical protein n=1 Tax=Massilia scottii TaxID=3057166 RepID=UPI0027968C86|nr:hypothetical protein [Massilia sp. CCM 9029]MDQ1829791.1 hypothetical protein [Massilia sp. CCM 9029]
MATVKKARPEVDGEVHLIVSDDASPSIPMEPGKTWRVTTVSVVAPNMERSNAIAARLCGGSNTCVALIEV